MFMFLGNIIGYLAVSRYRVWAKLWLARGRTQARVTMPAVR